MHLSDTIAPPVVNALMNTVRVTIDYAGHGIQASGIGWHAHKEPTHDNAYYISVDMGQYRDVGGGAKQIIAERFLVFASVDDMKVGCNEVESAVTSYSVEDSTIDGPNMNNVLAVARSAAIACIKRL